MKHCPQHLNAVFFTNSGTEAVEACLKFARAATGRSKFAYLNHGWHGLSMGGNLVKVALANKGKKEVEPMGVS